MGGNYRQNGLLGVVIQGRPVLSHKSQIGIDFPALCADCAGLCAACFGKCCISRVFLALFKSCLAY